MVTLRTILSTTPLGKAKLLAGEGGLDREVRETNIIEVPDTVRWMRGGEIVFSAGYAFAGNGIQGAELIQGLFERGITALALKPGKYMPVIPQIMIDRAEELNFPLLQMPEDMPYSICAEAIFEEIKDSRLYELRMLTTLQHELLEAGLHKGWQGICRALENQLGKKVILWDAEWHMRYGEISFSDCNGVDKQSGGQLMTIRGGDNAPLFIHPVETGDTFSRAFLGIESEINPQESELSAMRYAASLLGMELLKEAELERQYMRLGGSLLDNLLEGKRMDSTILHRQSMEYKVDLDNPWIIFAARKNSGELIPEKTLWHALKRGSESYHFSFLVTQKSVCAIGAIFFQQGKEKDCQNFLKELSTEGKFGISNIGTSLEKFPPFAAEAESALDVLCSIQTDRSVASLPELGVYYPLNQMRGQPAMDYLCQTTLGVILRYDSENSGELMETIEQYFNCGCNLRVTAEKMYLHKNSVSYRLRKIEELTGRSLEDPQFRLELQLCLTFQKLL